MHALHDGVMRFPLFYPTGVGDQRERRGENMKVGVASSGFLASEQLRFGPKSKPIVAACLVPPSDPWRETHHRMSASVTARTCRKTLTC